jgi:hypothetical protein
LTQLVFLQQIRHFIKFVLYFYIGSIQTIQESTDTCTLQESTDTCTLQESTDTCTAAKDGCTLEECIVISSDENDDTEFLVSHCEDSSSPLPDIDVSINLNF